MSLHVKIGFAFVLAALFGASLRWSVGLSQARRNAGEQGSPRPSEVSVARNLRHPATPAQLKPALANPFEAVESALLRPAWDRRTALRSAFAARLKSDPEGFRQWARANVRSIHQPDVLHALGQCFSDSDVAFIFSLARDLGPAEKNVLISAYLPQLQSYSSATQAALEVGLLESPLLKQWLYKSLGTSWGEIDRNTAFEWLSRSNLTFFEKRNAVEGIALGISRTSVRDAVKWLAEGQNDLTVGAMESVLRSAIRSGSGLVAVASIKELDPSNKAAYIRNGVAQALLFDPPTAAQMAFDFLGKEQAAPYIERALDQWHKMDPTSASQWVENNGIYR